ncbi:MAG: DUF5674 family protein [Candidatus Omnitrophota bacterium]
MRIEIIQSPTPLQELKRLAEENYGDMVKGVVDVQRKILALGGELHADGEALLLEEGSQQEDLWGFNLYPEKPKDERIEFSSLINIRPSQGNTSMTIQDARLKEDAKMIIEGFIKDDG